MADGPVRDRGQERRRAPPLPERRRARRGTAIVGAAIGTGLAARAAVRGGCDMLLALNAGRLRSMGAPSIASLLPLRDSNALVMDFGVSEILPARGAVPVFFGACCFDPRQPLEGIVDAIAAAGFDGIVNFPTSIFLRGGFRAAVERAGVGFDREVKMLRLARERGLATIGYVATKAEACRMAEAGVDIVNLNLGWNKGGHLGVVPSLDIAEAGEFARAVFSAVRRVRRETLCTVEGGPIISPRDMHAVCGTASADGYIGGSTIDRMPLESAIEDAASAFKMIGALQQRVEELERQTFRRKRDYGLIGWSAPMACVRRDIARLARTGRPVLVAGPPGSGKELVARSIAAEANATAFVSVPCDAWAEESLFGAAAGMSRRQSGPMIGLLEGDRRQHLFLDDVARLPASAQNRLVSVIETGSLIRLGDRSPRPATGRLILAHGGGGGLDPRLATLLADATIRLSPLADRLEDLPLLVRHFLTGGEGQAAIDPAVYPLLLAHGWPGNVRELRAVIETARATAGDQPIRPDHLPRFVTGAAAAGTPADEREWILDGLRRHRFRRGETAAFLGISRKTLYNKMRLHAIADQR